MEDVQIVSLNHIKLIFFISTCLLIVIDILLLRYGLKK